MVTPLLELEKYRQVKKRFFVKMECENPSGSLKDRMVSYVIDALEDDQKLQKNTTIVEASSGNTGIALAKVCPPRGYRTVICMPQKISQKKKELIRNYGAFVEEFDTGINPEADIERAKSLGAKRGYYFFNQFENPRCVEAYSNGLGEELIEQLNQQEIVIDVLVAGVGTGASLIGLAKRLLKDHNPTMEIHAVGPNQSPTKLEGLHPGFIRGDFKIWKQRPQPFEKKHHRVSDHQGIRLAKALSNLDFFVGPASGAVLETALNRIKTKGNYLLLFGDSGDRYEDLYANFSG